MNSISARRAVGILQEKGLFRSDCLDIVSYVSGVPYRDLHRKLDSITLPIDDFEAVLLLIDKDIPTAYITGRKEFYGLEFNVDRHTLIPRPDTETLVEAVLKDTDPSRPCRILDLCVGSGTILLSLLKHLPLAVGTGVDISQEALAVCRRNAVKFGVENRTTLIRQDLTSAPCVSGSFDIITSNPPYLSKDDYALAGPSIKYEPYGAIVAGCQRLFFYKLLLSVITKSGNNNASVYLETGYDSGGEVASIYDAGGYNTCILTDLAGRQRVVKAVRPSFN